jgi:phosphate transport system permease protein
VVLFSPLAGKLGLFVTFFFLYALAEAISSYIKFGSMTAKDSAIKVLLACGAVLTVLPIISILATVILKGYKGIKWNIFSNDMSLATTTDPLTSGGLLHAIVGTLLLVLGALILSVPIGILTALYLTEIRGRFSRPIRFLVQAMSGVPSIVAGLFILSAVVYTITKSTSGLMGSLALTILMIPTVARTSEEVLKLIPEDLREAGTALGGTQWRTVAMIVLPAAKSGLMTAVILGVARIAGETAPLLLVTGGGDALNFNHFDDPMGSLPFYIWKSFLAGSEEANTRAWAGLLVLIVLILILFTTARFLSSRKVAR